MKGENLPPELFKHFYSEELFYVPEAAKSASAASSAVLSAAPELPLEAAGTEKKYVAAQPEPVKLLPFLIKGGNRKKVAVILNLFDQDFENLSDQKLLLAILAAIKLGPDDVAFVNLTSQVKDLSEIIAEVDFENAILFLHPKHSLITHHKLKPFQPMSVQKKYVIAGAELSALQSYKEQKAQLWTGLQAMFL